MNRTEWLLKKADLAGKMGSEWNRTSERFTVETRGPNCIWNNNFVDGDVGYSNGRPSFIVLLAQSLALLAEIDCNWEFAIWLSLVELQERTRE